MRTRVAFLFVGLLVTRAACAASLYHEESYKALASDTKAQRIGDLVTVLVFENSSATSTADTAAQRVGSVGLEVDLPSTRVKAASIKPTNQFDGRGQTNRTGKLLAQITVSVRDVYPNGDLLVAGEQVVEINHEKQQIKLEGKVRARDLSEQNTILSTRLAEARISYIGDGDLAAHQRPSWWQRFLLWFGV